MSDDSIDPEIVAEAMAFILGWHPRALSDFNMMLDPDSVPTTGALLEQVKDTYTLLNHMVTVLTEDGQVTDLYEHVVALHFMASCLGAMILGLMASRGEATWLDDTNLFPMLYQEGDE